MCEAFPNAVYSKWMIAITTVRSDEYISYSYKAIGSGKGKELLLAGESDFAGSDSKLSSDEEKRCPECWFVPSLASAVAVVFNLPGFERPLQIPRSVLADIFSGKISHWAELAQWNTQLTGLQERIRVCVRADKSGTTEVFTSALASFSTDFKRTIGSSSLPDWPSTVMRSDGTSALAHQLLRTEYSIGYMGLADAKKWAVPYAKIENQGGVFTEPTAQAVQEALDASVACASSETRLFYQNIVDAAGPGVYLIAGLTYIVFNPEALDCKTLYNSH